MRAMVLAAGLGRRLRPYTDLAPKCMVTVAGKPMLQHVLEWLRDEGVRDVAVNLHYRPDLVVERFGDGSAFDLRLHWSYEATLLGTAGGVAAVREWLGDDRFLVVYGDNLIRCSLAGLRATHDRVGAVLTMALFHRWDGSKSGVVTVDDGDRVTSFREKPADAVAGGHWVSAGLYLCEPGVVDAISETTPSDFGHDVIPALLHRGETVGGHLLLDDDALYWIDTPEDLERTRAALEEAP